MNQNHGPLFRVVKRENTRWYHLAVSYASAIAAALLIGALLLSVQGVPAGAFFRDMFSLGVIGSKFAYKNVEGFIRLFIPLLITSVALSLAFRMRFWNVGGEGQFIIGALCAGFVAFRLDALLASLAGESWGDAVWGKLLMVVCMALAGFFGGGLYGVIAAVLKVKYGTNETLLTLMLNYIALYLILFFGETKASWNFFLSTESERPIFATFPAVAKMITLPTPFGRFSLNLSLIVAVLICAGIFVYLKYTKQGYEIAVVGDSPSTAMYAGMKVGRIVIRTVFLSAALIGLAGAFYASSAGTLSTSITNDVGWTGVTVAWLSKLNTAAIFVSSLFLTVLQYGSQVASTSYPTVDANFAKLLQGVILFAVLAADFFTRFKLVGRTKAKRQEVLG